MYSNTRFNQILEDLPRAFLHSSVDQRQADRYVKSFSVYDHLIALIYAQLSGVKSLRELEAAFNSQQAVHYHLGTHAIRRSTLSDANSRRDPAVFQKVVERLMACIHRKQRKELKELICLLDSTPIQLKKPGYEWAKKRATHRTTGLKLHVVLNSPFGNPSYLNITPANVNDITDAKGMTLSPNTLYVFDKGYCSYAWWHEIHQVGGFFVTRFKRDAGLEVIEEHSMPSAEVLKDEVVAFKHRSNRAKHVNPYYGETLRRITIKREGGSPLVLATNIMDRPASEIGKLYKQRWQIELFFKWIKQNLKIKVFMGKSENAVKLQIYAAIAAYLLLWIYKAKKGLTASLHLVLTELRPKLFQRTESDYHRERWRHRREVERYIRRVQHAFAF